MADVIPFASRRRRFSPPSPTSDAGAQILFFTGVRYERVAEPPQRKASARLGRSSAAPKGAGRRKARQPA